MKRSTFFNVRILAFSKMSKIDNFYLYVSQRYLRKDAIFNSFRLLPLQRREKKTNSQLKISNFIKMDQPQVEVRTVRASRQRKLKEIRDIQRQREQLQQQLQQLQQQQQQQNHPN